MNSECSSRCDRGGKLQNVFCSYLQSNIIFFTIFLRNVFKSCDHHVTVSFEQTSLMYFHVQIRVPTQPVCGCVHVRDLKILMLLNTMCYNNDHISTSHYLH